LDALREVLSVSQYTGDGTSGIYLWGAQLEQSTTVGEYIPTTSTINSAPRFDHDPTTGESLGLLVEEQRTNIFLQSERIDQSPWTLTLASVVAETSVLPNGGNSAYKLVPDSGSGAGLCRQNPTLADNTVYTISIFAKAAGFSQFFIQLFDKAGTFAQSRTIDLSTGGVSGSETGSSITSAVNYGNGWYRLILANVNSLSGATTPNVRFRVAGTGDGTSGIYFWGAQLEAGSFPTSYIPTTAATATRAADVASISGSNFGVSRTNLLLRSEEFDNASWNSAAGARTITPNSVAAPDGLLTADTFAADGTTNAHFVSQSLTLSAVPYAYSVFAKAGTNNFLQLRTFNAFGGMWANFDLATGVVGTVGFVSGAAPTSSIQAYPNGWYRCTMLFTPTATTSSVAAYIVNSASAGGSLANSLSTTLYLWGAQLETGSTATAYIPTTTAAVTVVESPWYRQDEGTVFTEFNRPAAVTGLRSIAAVSDGGYNNRMTLRTDSAVFMNSFVTTGGVNQATFPLAINSGANNKAALAYATNDFNAGVNGVSGTNDTVGTVPVVDRLSIGSVLNAEPSCSYVRRLTYWPARLPNETLQTITQ
jgi:hypothetical protein